MNIRDIARIANVTPGTVSKVLNNYPDISESTRAHVKKVIEEYQYRPTTGTRATMNQTGDTTIGLAIEGIYNSLYSEMHQMISNRLHNAGYTIVSYSDNYYVQDKVEKFQEILKYTKSHNLTGFIYLGGSFANVPEEYFNKLSCPTIFVDSVLPASFKETNYSSIKTNDLECSVHQINFLIDKGHKDIALVISSKDDNSIYGVRYEGYQIALKNAGLEHNLSNVVEGQYVYDKTYNKLKEFLEKHKEITAICVNADIMAPAVLRAIHDLGKTVGKDIDVISYDGLELAEYLIPSVTCFKQPKKEMVDSIYDLLIGLMSKKKNHQHIVFQSKLVTRESFK